MLTKRKETRSFISTGCGNIGPIEEGYDYFPQIQIKKKPKNGHSILSILIFLLPLLLTNEVAPNEFFFCDNKPNEPKIKWITKYLAFFVGFIRASASFILIIEIFITSIYLYNENTEKGARGEGSEKALTYQRNSNARKNHFQSENGLYERKNDSKNTLELSNGKKMIKDHNSKVINLGIRGQKYYTRSFILLSYIFINVKIPLGIYKFIIIDRCSYIYIMKFRFFNQGTNQKNTFSKISFDITKFVSSKDDGYYYFIIADIILVRNTTVDEFDHSIEIFMQIKIITRNISYKLFKSKFSEFIIYNYDILLGVSKRKVHSICTKDCISVFNNNILNIIFVNSLILIIIDIYIIILNIIKKNEEKIIYFIFIKKEVTKNYLYSYINEFIEIKKINNNYKKNKNDNIIINQRNKRKIFLIRNIKINFIKIIKYIILLNLFNNMILNNKSSLIKYKSYNITLKIKGIGTKNICTSHTYFKSEYYPNEVYINGYIQNDVIYNYYLNETDNII